jgi:hypothetical protein
MKSILQSHHEWWLIPEEVDLLGRPFRALRTKCKIEVVQQFANDKADFAVCQAIIERGLVSDPYMVAMHILLSKAVSWSKAKRLQDVLLVLVEAGVVA